VTSGRHDRRVSGAQNGVIATRQLNACGVDHDAIRVRVAPSPARTTVDKARGIAAKAYRRTLRQAPAEAIVPRPPEINRRLRLDGRAITPTCSGAISAWQSSSTAAAGTTIR